MASPAELLRSVLAGDAKISEVTAQLKDRVKLPTGKKDDPKDVAAFDKAWGVPEKPEGYKVWAPDGFEYTDMHKGLIAEAVKDFHKAHFNQAQVDIALQALDRAERMAEKTLGDESKARKQATDDALVVEYGSRQTYEANRELANRYLQQTFGPYFKDAEGNSTLKSGMLDLQLADGSYLGDHQGFVQGIIALAKQASDDGLPIAGEPTEGVDIDKRISEITSIAHSDKPADKREYARLQPELDRLIAARNRRNTKGKAA
jgi:hypothetical protein